MAGPRIATFDECAEFIVRAKVSNYSHIGERVEILERVAIYARQLAEGVEGRGIARLVEAEVAKLGSIGEGQC